MHIKFIPLLFAAVFLISGISSCVYNPIVTHPPCDTCCDTCHKPCDTCKKPCDTCNLNQDSLAHAFNWVQLSIPGETNLTGCWVFGQNDIYIVGNSLWHYNGMMFTIVPAFDQTYNNITLNGGLNGSNIFAFSKTDLWMVSSGVLFHTVDGTHYSDSRPGGQLNACWGTSSNDMFFVGGYGLIYHYDGTSFTKMNSNTGTDLNAVWGTSDKNVWACGRHQANNATVLVHYDGSNWSIDDLSNDNEVKQDGMEATWAIDSSISHQYVAVSGAYVYRMTDNQPWRVDQSVPNQIPGDSTHRVGLQAIQGNNPNDLWVAGDWGWLGHWSGKTWGKYPTLFDYSNKLYGGGQMSVNGNTICVVGFKSGNSWVAIGTRKQ